MPVIAGEEWRDPVAQAAHGLNNTLGVLRLTVDLLEQGAVEPEGAIATLREQIGEAVTLVSRVQHLARGR